MKSLLALSLMYTAMSTMSGPEPRRRYDYSGRYSAQSDPACDRQRKQAAANKRARKAAKRAA